MWVRDPSISQKSKNPTVHKPTPIPSRHIFGGRKTFLL